ncbi:YbhB/YbcL family Raf kinase inhibitor-like protein [Spongiactinospora gelatinilytica]|uniref:YbhB/YbcL family Raf kinase inhibitor-like protein n=1 Tax=Spongiactinospora gelatinilytica TaxID=2666298 RepID=A0A2W2EMX0_9ACTN|nr:YbhB/YbcL family Raf kinase inhibitor-like protein [Spongiactinospora gelatinilytica]PZG17945.1 YbhB/YbcL family Raf kinase inhibitor-like protein [Spongiactinospora gelatinilytica]
MSQRPPIPYDFLPQVPTLTVESDDVRDGERMSDAHVFDDWGSTGQNISPHLRWSPGPEGTKSYAVTCYDPDAPTGSGFWHWLAFDIPADVTELPRGASGSVATKGLPQGTVESRNDYNRAMYGGAAPPPGYPHRYLFAVHALGVEKLGLDPETPPAAVGFNITANTLARGYIAPTYET